MPKIMDLLSGGLLKDVGGIIDNLHTSGEEKAEAEEAAKKARVERYLRASHCLGS